MAKEPVKDEVIVEAPVSDIPPAPEPSSGAGAKLKDGGVKLTSGNVRYDA